MSKIPDIRIRTCNSAPLREEGDFVLYWMIACRRLGWNFALERAAELARRSAKPLVILEPLRCGYRWANDRIHRFVIEGMADHAARLARSRVLYHPYVEPEPGAGKGLLEALGRRAAVVVTDDYPAFFLPRMIAAAAARLPVQLEAVDSNGLLPLRATDKSFVTAAHFRRFLQRALPAALARFPAEDPLTRLPPRLKSLPAEIAERWPAASPEMLNGGSLTALPIDHAVPPVADVRGGDTAGERTLEGFLDERLERYGEGRNDPGESVTSGLSPYLWGKKVIEWSESPRAALAVLIDLNNRYALDGRDPNSYTGIFWCFGRYDRPWPPERPIFGTVRYMSSDSTRKKYKVDGYIARYGGSVLCDHLS